ncbi:MAG: hypothetical protein EOP39_04630 [Rubrivivax sp.]|nr:MAG: hypothetical protein EOP39_04630 [Rubrivivax sp.]
MSDEIASVGIKVETDGITGGIKALDALADQGPKVERALQGVETASTKTGKSLKTLGDGGADAGLSKVAKTSAEAATAVGKLADASAKSATSVKQIDKASADTARAISGVGSAVKSLVSSNEAVVTSIRGMSAAQTAYTDKLAEESRQLRATVAERDRYIAQAQGMLSASKEIAAAIGGQVGALKQVQGASTQAGESLIGLARTGVAGFLGGALASGAKAAAAAIYEASAAGERLRTMLNFATGGKSAEEIEYLRKVTNRLGLEFTSTATAYGQFQAAAKGTALEGQKARDVFESIAKASAVMGLSTEQSGGALLALQQMFSKGTVQAEELRGQLGERLPGAFQIAAKAMGVTTAELGKLLEQGLVVADDFLPKFARAINENIGGAAEGAADRLDAATNRFGNAWEKLKQTIGDAGISKAIQGELKGLTNDVTVFGETMDKVAQKGGGLFAQLSAGTAVEAGRLTFSVLNAGASDFNRLVNLATGSIFKLNENVGYLPDILKTNAQQAAALTQDLARAEAEFAALQARGAATSQNIYLRSEFGYLAQYIAKLKEAQAEKAKLETGPAYSAARDSQSASVSEATRLEAVRNAMQKVQQGLSGVKDSFYKDLNALKAGYDEGLIKLIDYQAEVKKLINESGGGKLAATALKATSKELAEQKKLTLELAGLTGDFLEEWNRLPKIYKDVDKLTEAQARLLAKQPAIKAAKQEEIALNRALYAQQQQTSDELAAAYVSESKAREQGRLAVYEYGRAIDEQNTLTELELGLVGRTQQAREVALAQYRIELELKKQIQAIDKNAGFDEAQRIEERTKAREAAARAMAGAERRVYVDEWKRTSDEIERSLTDALLRGFESGKGFAENLKDTVVNMFKTMVLRPVIQGVVQMGMGAVGLGGYANAAASAGGQSQFSTLMNVYSAGSAGSSLYAVGSQYLAGTMSGANAAGTLYANATGTGLDGLLATNGAYGTAGSAGGAGAGANAGTWSGTAAQGVAGVAIGRMAGQYISGGYSAFGGQSGNSAVNTGAVVGAVVGSIVPVIGTLVGGIVGGAIGGLVNRAFGHGAKEYSAQGVDGMLGGAAGVSGTAYADYKQKGGWFRSDKYGTDTAALSTEQAQMLAAGALAVRTEVKNWAEALKLPAQDLESITTAFKVKLGDNAAENQAALTVAFTDYQRALASQFSTAVAPFKKAGEEVEQTLLRLVNMQAFTNQLAKLGGVFDTLSKQAFGVQDVFITAAGGQEALANKAGQFFQDFYSEAERTALVTAQVSAEMQRLGVPMQATREGYRALIDQQLALGDEGAKLAAKLLDLSPAFASVVGATESAATDLNAAAEKMAEAGRKMLSDLTDQQGALQAELLRAQGQGEAAAALERQRALARITEGLNGPDASAATAAYDYNEALREQIAVLNAAKSAAEQAAQAEAQRVASIAQERAGLEERLLQQQGDPAAMRARELASLDASNRAILEHIYALQDQAAAQEAAAQSAQQLADKQAAIANQRDGIQARIDQLLGNTAAIRARELAGLDASNRELQERYYRMEDERAANEAATQAAQQASQAAEQLRSAWQSVTDSLLDEVRRIRGEIAGESAQSFAAAQTQFTLATMRARGGDEEAAKLLPSLSEALLTLAQSQLSSAVDLKILRAQTAASLGTTAGQIASRFGATLPRLDTGTNNVPHDMVAMLHKGEAVVPRAYNPALAGADSKLLGELIAAVNALRADQRAQATTEVQVAKDTLKVLKDWDQRGIPEERATA